MSYLFDPEDSEYIPFAKNCPLWISAYERKIKPISKEALNELETDVKKIWQERISKGDLPKSLFKYRSFNNGYHLNILTKNELYLSPYERLNDPYDGNIIPLFNFASQKSINNLRNFNKDFIRIAVKQNLGRTYKELNNLNFSRLDKNKLNARIKGTIKKIGGLNSPYLWKEFFFSMLQPQTYRSAGVLSLSLDNTDNLLWAHYGESHTGFCIEFDYCSLLIDAITSGRILHWGEVFYAKSRPQYDVVSDAEILAQLLLSTKSIEWEYEKEFRIISNRSHGLFKIKPSTIKNIYLGVRCSKENANNMKRLLTGSLAHVGLFILKKKDPFGQQSYRKI